MVKEITVYTYGDANSLETWSNVPYYFTHTLEKRGIKVNKVNVAPNKFVEGLWNRIFLKFLRLFLSQTTYTFERTPFFRWVVNRKMKKSIKEFPKTDLFISLSFSYHPKKYTTKPVLLFCDWTYGYLFEYFKQRKPDRLERQEIINQKKVINSADKVFVLFPDVAKYMKNVYENENIFYLGNVINSNDVKLSEENLKKKFKQKNLVFIGSKKYLSGLLPLIQAVSNLRDKYPDLELDVIGMTERQIKGKIDNSKLIGIHFKGYLNKSLDVDCKLYYKIVSNSTFFVNTTPRWSAFSATLDVMYNYTPIIISRYRSFVETFGRTLDFGSYCDNSADEIEKKIDILFSKNFETYRELCIQAHKKVTPFSWQSYIEKLLQKSQNLK